MQTRKKILAGIAHIWQELLYEDGCTALIVLDSLGRTVDAMRTVLFNTVGEIERPLQATRIAASSEPISRQEAAFAQQGAKAPAQNGDGKTEEDPLEAYARNLTQAAARHELEPLIGREAELDAMIQILGKKMKNNPLLLGEPGVGKSALAEGLAMRVASRDVPPSLLGAQIYALDLALLVAGTKFRGEFEERIKGVVSSAQERGNVILFIDELHAHWRGRQLGRLSGRGQYSQARAGTRHAEGYRRDDIPKNIANTSKRTRRWLAVSSGLTCMSRIKHRRSRFSAACANDMKISTTLKSPTRP
ncbi:MAG: AAA family ATPase [Christensenellales bacterium]